MSASEKSKRKRLRMVNGTGDSSSSLAAPPPRQPFDDSSCTRCFGTGVEVVPGEGARRCDCQTTDNRERLFRNARIPPRYQHCTLTNFEASLEAPEDVSKLRAKGEALLVLEHFADLDGR